MKLLGKYLICLFSIGLNIKYLFYDNNIALRGCVTTTESENRSGHHDDEGRHRCCKRVNVQYLENEKLIELLRNYTTELIELRLSLTLATSTKLVIDEHFKTVQNLLTALSTHHQQDQRKKPREKIIIKIMIIITIIKNSATCPK